MNKAHLIKDLIRESSISKINSDYYKEIGDKELYMFYFGKYIGMKLVLNTLNEGGYE